MLCEFNPFHAEYSGSNMSVHVVLNLPSILTLFRNKFNKFNNTGAQMKN